MAENKVKSEPRDFKERFEFRLTIGDNIICQRYFKINNFNPTCLKSFELPKTIERCAEMIDDDLKSKTQVYLEIVAPRIFKTKEEMLKHFENYPSDLRIGEGIMILDKKSPDYAWGRNGQPVALSEKIEDEDFSKEFTNDDILQYKLSFMIDGREVVSSIWEGIYPKYIRNSIDLSNKKGRVDENDIMKLSFDQYLLHKIVEGRVDLVWSIIKEICSVCSCSDRFYTTEVKIGNKTYKNHSESEKMYLDSIDRGDDKSSLYLN